VEALAVEDLGQLTHRVRLLVAGCHLSLVGRKGSEGLMVCYVQDVSGL
jgi:hypothetical protein